MISDAFYPIGLACATAAMVLLALFPPWSRRSSDHCESSACPMHGPIAGALALGLAFVVAFIVLVGQPELPPRERWHWLIAQAVVAMVMALLSVGQPRRMQLVFGVALGVATGLLLQPPADQSVWTLKIGLAVMVMMLWLASPSGAISLPSGAVALVMMLTFAGASVVLLQGRFATLALLSGSLSAVCGVTAVFAQCDRRTRGIAEGLLKVTAVLLPALLLTGWLYRRDHVPAAAYGLPMASPMMLWLMNFASRGAAKTRVAVVVAATLAVVPSVAAALWALIATKFEFVS